jgi:hypothetical protein
MKSTPNFFANHPGGGATAPTATLATPLNYGHVVSSINKPFRLPTVITKSGALKKTSVINTVARVLVALASFSSFMRELILTKSLDW